MSDNRPSTSWAVWAWQAYQERRLVEAHALPADPRVEKLVEALKPFARIADVSETAEPGESVTVNVDRCRAARDALAAWETDHE